MGSQLVNDLFMKGPLLLRGSNSGNRDGVGLCHVAGLYTGTLYSRMVLKLIMGDDLGRPTVSNAAMQLSGRWGQGLPRKAGFGVIITITSFSYSHAGGMWRREYVGNEGAHKSSQNTQFLSTSDKRNVH